MARHYSYRVDHDRGFAPHVEGGLCTLCGCKKTTIERWAEEGTWVIGIGGNNTGKADRLIYVMKVEEILTYSEFKKTRPTDASYLKGHGTKRNAPVLVSTHFYYFGDQAPPLRPELSHIIHPTQGCKRLTDADIDLLSRLVLSHYPCGELGKANNVQVESSCTSCRGPAGADACC